MKKISLFLTIISILLITGCGNNKEIEEQEQKPVEEKKLQIIDQESNSRVIAVQINNHNQARLNHAGLQDAFVIYEAIVEGGITRMLAFYKDKTTEKIGSVRSSRPYFLDYVLENDAIYVHFGFSEQAKKDISTLGINNINGLYDDAFWRDNSLNVAYEHKAFTSMERIKKMISHKNYRTTSNSKTVLNYSIDEITIDEQKEIELEDGTKEIKVENQANTIIIPYSNYMTVKYEYDNSNKVYNRFANNAAHIDAISKKQYNFKNIIIIKVKNYSIDSYGRQALDNIGKGSGYFITNGCVKEITWQKDSRNSKTIYKYLDDTEIKVNDGNTFIQIIPINSKVTIS